jgi:hypothetical protein
MNEETRSREDLSGHCHIRLKEPGLSAPLLRLHLRTIHRLQTAKLPQVRGGEPT